MKRLIEVVSGRPRPYLKIFSLLAPFLKKWKLWVLSMFILRITRTSRRAGLATNDSQTLSLPRHVKPIIII